MAEDTRPLCKCHGEPMVRNSFQPNGNQKWGCGRKRRLYGRRRYWERGEKAKRAALYQDRKRRQVCTRCEGPLTTEALCWDCLNELEERHAVRI